MFAETAVGVKGILGIGTSVVGGWDAGLFFDRELVANGGFGINARFGGAFGKGTNKFLIGFQPELNFVFGRNEKRGCPKVASP